MSDEKEVGCEECPDFATCEYPHKGRVDPKGIEEIEIAIAKYFDKHNGNKFMGIHGNRFSLLVVDIGQPNGQQIVDGIGHSIGIADAMGMLPNDKAPPDGHIH